MKVAICAAICAAVCAVIFTTWAGERGGTAETEEYPPSDVLIFRAEVLPWDDNFYLRNEDSILFVRSISAVGHHSAGGRYFISRHDYITVFCADGEPLHYSEIPTGSVVEITYHGLVLLTDPAVIPAATSVQMRTAVTREETLTFRAEVLSFEYTYWGDYTRGTCPIPLWLVRSITPSVCDIYGREYRVREADAALDADGNNISYSEISEGSIVEITFCGRVLLTIPPIISAPIIQLVE
ncbi:MAG: hypothetical protein FWB96_04455 [Defluviitaleaceae bacterium]|nr:hypothetical protein [Defluviitaleaceae bacterium]MCL2263748.1 hypothetical protein [Defluviitaleaceae bacterium]